MSINKQKQLKRFLKYYCTIVSLIIGIVCSLLVYFDNFNKTFEYPEKEYQEMEELIKQVVDVDQRIVKYNLEVPDNMSLSFDVVNNKPSAKISTKYEKEVFISILAYFDTTGNLIIARDSNNKAELNKGYKTIAIIVALFIGIICFLGECLIFIPIKKYIIRVETCDTYEDIKASYLVSGKNAKTL